MGTYQWDGSAWSDQGVLRVRNGSEWTTQNDYGAVWNGTEWQAFQPLASSALLPPESLVVTPDDLSAACVWVNPTQPTLTPTDIQVRIPETTSVWTEYPYPSTTASFGFLQPATNYQVQVRYVIRELGSITAVSAITEQFFTTNALSGPGTPAADPGGTGPDTTIPFGDVAGTPGIPGSSDCWWEYVVQEQNGWALGEIAWADTATTAEVDGDVGSIELDFIALGFTGGSLVRLKYREVCDSVDGDWNYGPVFMVPTDWDVSCGGIADSPAWASTPYSTAISLMPQYCVQTGDPLAITDNVTDSTYSKEPGYFGKDESTDHIMVGRSDNSTYGSPLSTGYFASIAAITGDSSFSFDVSLFEQPATDLLGGTKLASYGDRVTFRAYAEGSGYRIGVVFAKTGGGSFSLQSTTELALDDWVGVGVSIDADGSKVLYINGVADTTDTDTTAPLFTDISGNHKMFGNASARYKRVGVWNVALSAADFASMFFSISEGEPELWLAPTALVTSGSDVTSWTSADDSIYTRDLVAVGTSYPQDGGGYAVFDGLDTELQWSVDPSEASAGRDVLWGDNSLGELMIVCRLNASAVTDGVVLGGWDTGDADAEFKIVIKSDGNVLLSRTSDTASSVINYTTTTAPFADNDWHVLHFFDHHNWIGLEVDGVELMTGIRGTLGSATSIDRVQVGALQSAEYFHGDIMEIACFAETDSFTNIQPSVRNAAHAALGTKAGASVTTYDPVAVSGGVGDTLALTGVAGWVDFSDSDNFSVVGNWMTKYGTTATVTGGQAYTYDQQPIVAGPGTGQDAFLRNGTAYEFEFSSTSHAESAGTHAMWTYKWDGVYVGVVATTRMSTDSGDWVGFEVDATGKVTQHHKAGGSLKANTAETGTSLADGEWHVIRMHVDQPNLDAYLYVDTVLVATTTNYSAVGSAYSVNQMNLYGEGYFAEACYATDTGGNALVAEARMMARAGLA